MRATIAVSFLMGISCLTAVRGNAQRVAAGLRFGTLGIGPEVQIGVSRVVAFRAGYSYFAFVAGEQDYSGINFDTHARISVGTILLDIHPFKSAFRLSGGVVFNGIRLSGTSDVDQPVFIGNNEYLPSQVQSISGSIAPSSFGGYAGLGFDGAIPGTKGVKFAFDFGLIFQGAPTVAPLTAQTTLTGATAAQLQRDLEIQTAETQADVDENLQDVPGNGKLYPVLQFGIIYRF